MLPPRDCAESTSWPVAKPMRQTLMAAFIFAVGCRSANSPRSKLLAIRITIFWRSPSGSERVIKLVLFDIDGTLIRTGGAGVKAFAKVFETEFRAVDGFERLKFAGRTDYSIVREFFNVHNIPASPENFQRFFERYV